MFESAFDVSKHYDSVALRAIRNPPKNTHNKSKKDRLPGKSRFNAQVNSLSENFTSQCDLDAIDDLEQKPSGHIPLDIAPEFRNRENQDVYVLKKFHNDIKLQLIRMFAPLSDKRLIDFCCGQGTDIHKWNKCNFSHVQAFDISQVAIIEAERRYVESNYRSQGLCIEFSVLDLGSGNVQPLIHNKKYPIATCFFAIQYFFREEGLLKNLLKNVSESLAPGGYFIGTCPDAKEIMKLITEDAIAYATNRVIVERFWTDPVSAFGSMVEHEIKYTVTWSDNKSRNREYLVFESVLKKAAEAFGLVPIDWAKLVSQKGRNPLSSLLHAPHSGHGLFRLFNPKIEEFGEDKYDLYDVSSTYAAFAFRKT